MSEQNEPKKPGRKPAGDKALTSAEKMKAFRDRRKQEGYEFFQVSLRGNTLHLINEMAKSQGRPRTEVLQGLLNITIFNMLKIAAAEQALQAKGLSDAALIAALTPAIEATLNPMLDIPGI